MKGYTSPKGVSASTETLAGESDLFTFIKEALGPILDYLTIQMKAELLIIQGD